MAVSPVPCNGGKSLFSAIPYLLFPNDTNQLPNRLTGNDEDNILRFWIHIGLVFFGLVIAFVSLFGQAWRPFPYGKHSAADSSCNLPVRPAYMAMNLIPGFIIFTITYFTGLHFDSPINIALYVLFIFHYITRGLVTPLVSRYSEKRITMWVPVVIFLINTVFHYMNAEFIGSVDYCEGYHYDPRFIIGVVLFVTGFCINRISDTQVIFLRKSRKDPSYFLPKGFLYHPVSSPHYFGEGLQWFGWAVMTWSLAGLVWWLYTESVFFPRSWHNHAWYTNQFPNYPRHRRALLPLIF